MKVFVSNVDSTLGHNLSRLFSVTTVDHRREEEPEEDEDDEQDEKVKEEKAKENYNVVGTLQTPVEGAGPFSPRLPAPMVETGDKKKDAARRQAIEKFALTGQKPKWVAELADSKDRAALKTTLLSSDVIVYDLVSSLEEASWAIEMLAEEADSFADKPKTFIGISSVMTWAKTKVDPDDPEAFLAEDEYRRRKPHPNFKAHLAAEKNIIKTGKKGALRTYVIAAGLIYHASDSIFHSMFKSAWHNEDLTCYGEGDNVMPTIYIDDLCHIVVETAESLPESRYMLAIDDSKHTLYEITKAISDALGTGKVIKAPKETALLNKDLPQMDYDMLLLNLRLDPGHAKDMAFQWKFEAGLIENLNTFIDEYKYARGLTSLNIIIHGPPASGKSTLSAKLAEHYEIHCLDVDKVVEAAVERLERRVAGNLTAEEADDDIDADREQLEELKEAARTNNGRYPDEHVINFVRDKLRSMPCRNQGYVMDGYPNTLDEARDLFRAVDEDGEERGPIKLDDLVAPHHVISLDISDDLIKERIMQLPDSAVAGTKNAEEALTRRLEEYRAINTDEVTVLNFFDEAEVHPLIVSTEANNVDAVMAIVTKQIGRPHNYGPTEERLAEERKLADEAKANEATFAEEEKQRREKEEEDRQSKAVAEWNSRLEEVRKQEQEVLEAQSVPLRNYLMKFVMPTLTSGLIEVCKARPEDPIDYLAEFLFKHNPTAV
ncbi:Adenylate kinase 7 [Thoreauomyces humboldtii]|nr:Adenylate kinase 7 [Thoreauomyces humboldtii]